MSASSLRAASRNRPLKVGLILPDTENEMGGETARWSDLANLARAAETLGYDSLWNADHLIYRFEGKEQQGPWECWSIMAGLAAVTSSIEIGPLVAATAYRNPALQAKIAETVDEISNGRLVLGLGAGWLPSDYSTFGYPYDHRVSRFAEAVEIIHGLLRKDSVTFSGNYYTVDNCQVKPRGPRPGGIPIMIGILKTNAPRMFDLLAKYGDIWNAWARQTVEEIEADRDAIDAAMTLAGRDPATVARTVSLLVDLPSSTGRPSEEKAAFRPRTPDELAEKLFAYSHVGISHVQLMLDPNTMTGIEWAARALEKLDR